MKKIKNFLSVFGLLVVMSVILVPTLFAQTTTDELKPYEMENGKVLRWNEIDVDSAGTIWSQTLDLTNYDNYAWTTDGVYIGGKATTATGNPKLILDYYVCYGTPDSTANWVLGNDSLMTCNATTVFGASTLRFTTKAPYIKFKLTNAATGKPVIKLWLGIYFVKRDEN